MVVEEVDQESWNEKSIGLEDKETASDGDGKSICRLPFWLWRV